MKRSSIVADDSSYDAKLRSSLMVDEMAEQEPTENSQYMNGKHQAINEFVQAQFQSIAQTK